MAESQDFATHIVDLLDSFGTCQARPMFGGFGLFHQGLMIGLIAEGSLYLKADDASRHLFEAEGSEAFSYFKKDKEFKLSYYLAPDDFFEDDDSRQRWADIAYAAALRNPNRRKGPKKKSL